MNNQLRREGVKMKLWSTEMTGGLPKCKRMAPKSQPLSKHFYPTLCPDFWDVFFSVSLPTGGSDEEIWQPCTAISDEDMVQRGFSFLWGPWQPLCPRGASGIVKVRSHHQAPALIPPDCLTSLPQHLIKAFRGCQRERKGWRDTQETELTANPSLVEML